MQSQCPNCKSYKVTSDRQNFAAAGIAMIVLGGLLSFLIFPLIFFFIGCGLIIKAVCSKAKELHCQTCNYSWKIGA